MPVTQKSIAQHLGISRSAVAQVLSGIGRPHPDTREKILQAARELGYRPNSLARALVTGKTGTLGFWYSPALDPHSMNIINGLDQKVRPYKLMLTNVFNRETRELPDEFPTADWPMDGIFALSIGGLPDWIVGEDGRPNRPLVSICYDAFAFRPTEQTDAILIRIRPGNEAAMRHLVQTRKRVAMLCVESMPLYGDVRVQVYEATMQEAGRGPEYILVPQRRPWRLQARQAVADHVRAQGCPDAILCGNDEQATAAHAALHDLGFRVPQDVALIGNDGLEEAEYHVPALSTIAQPFEEVIEAAWEFLQKRIAEPDSPRQYLEIDAPLLLRESSALP